MEEALTNEKGNFFFGFHDLVAWNANGDKIAALRIDDIKTPPNQNTPCDIGFIQNKRFIKLGNTYAYNYPQGARQQWVGKSNILIVNDINSDKDKWCSKLYDTEALAKIDELEYPTHVLTDHSWAFGIDYARLHRVGGYGYTGLSDNTAIVNAPDNIGIIKHNICTKEHSLLVSIKEVANCQAQGNDGLHHYITHLVLNPSQDRIAFLHRYKLKDGGETTRLMTIGVDGKDLSCLASGFLSHFDWKDNEHIAIWGRIGSGVEKLRNSILYKLIPTSVVFHAKKIIKKIISRTNDPNATSSAFNWLVFKDSPKNAEQSFLAKGIIKEDGHPMFCPANRDWLVCDNYPNIEGVRTLFLFQTSTQKIIELGKYKMLDDKPDLSKIKDTLKDVEPSVLKSFNIENMAFYRSGLHCDLHPRWNSDGTAVAFDSIHEGKRNIYSIQVGSIIGTEK